MSNVERRPAKRRPKQGTIDGIQWLVPVEHLLMLVKDVPHETRSAPHVTKDNHPRHFRARGVGVLRRTRLCQQEGNNLKHTQPPVDIFFSSNNNVNNVNNAFFLLLLLEKQVSERLFLLLLIKKEISDGLFLPAFTGE